MSLKGRNFLVFDLGETLLNFNLDGLWREVLKEEAIPRMFTALLAQSKEFTGKRITAAHFSEVVYRNIAIEDVKEKNISMHTRIRRYFEFLGIPQYAAYIQSQINAFGSTLQDRVEIYPEVKETLEDFLSEGYLLGLVSNTPWQCPGSIIAQYMDKFRIAELFEYMVFSGDINLKKPNPEIFQYLLDLSKIKKSDMVYIGNSSADIITSKRFGVPMVWINRLGKYNLLPDDCPSPDYTIKSLHDLKNLLPIL